MLSSQIQDEEQLYRAVPSKPQLWKKDTNRPSSALFKDSKGISVDRDGSRTVDGIIEALESRISINLIAVIRLKANECRNEDLHLIATPMQDNAFHAEIHHSANQIQLSSSKAKRLAQLCEIVAHYEST